MVVGVDGRVLGSSLFGLDTEMPFIILVRDDIYPVIGNVSVEQRFLVLHNQRPVLGTLRRISGGGRDTFWCHLLIAEGAETQAPDLGQILDRQHTTAQEAFDTLNHADEAPTIVPLKPIEVAAGVESAKSITPSRRQYWEGSQGKSLLQSLLQCIWLAPRWKAICIVEEHTIARDAVASLFSVLPFFSNRFAFATFALRLCSYFNFYFVSPNAYAHLVDNTCTVVVDIKNRTVVSKPQAAEAKDRELIAGADRVAQWISQGFKDKLDLLGELMNQWLPTLDDEAVPRRASVAVAIIDDWKSTQANVKAEAIHKMSEIDKGKAEQWCQEFLTSEQLTGAREGDFVPAVQVLDRLNPDRLGTVLYRICEENPALYEKLNFATENKPDTAQGLKSRLHLITQAFENIKKLTAFHQEVVQSSATPLEDASNAGRKAQAIIANIKPQVERLQSARSRFLQAGTRYQPTPEHSAQSLKRLGTVRASLERRSEELLAQITSEIRNVGGQTEKLESAKQRLESVSDLLNPMAELGANLKSHGMPWIADLVSRESDKVGGAKQAKTASIGEEQKGLSKTLQRLAELETTVNGIVVSVQEAYRELLLPEISTMRERESAYIEKVKSVLKRLRPAVARLVGASVKIEDTNEAEYLQKRLHVTKEFLIRHQFPLWGGIKALWRGDKVRLVVLSPLEELWDGASGANPMNYDKVKAVMAASLATELGANAIILLASFTGWSDSAIAQLRKEDRRLVLVDLRNMTETGGEKYFSPPTGERTFKKLLADLQGGKDEAPKEHGPFKLHF
jgi:hypothetical protein